MVYPCGLQFLTLFLEEQPREELFSTSKEKIFPVLVISLIWCEKLTTGVQTPYLEIILGEEQNVIIFIVNTSYFATTLMVQ
jgi:hypothetical protein